MLEHAIREALIGNHVAVFAASRDHMGTMGRQLEDLVPKKKKVRAQIKERLWVCSFQDVTQGNLGRFGIYRNYNYRTNSFVRVDPKLPPEERVVSLIDHYALETHLGNVIKYLRTAQHLANHTQWLIDTARMLTMLGRKVYVVTDDPETRQRIAEADLHRSVSVEDGEHLSNLNLLDQELIGAHPNTQLLIEPKTLERHFRGALAEINRWNLQ
jgi:hypothetical protein